jgi:hypothetical protein
MTLARALPLVLLTACSASPALVASVKNASNPSNLPKVVGCYEDAFENAGFSGEYDAVVDFDVEAGTGRIVDAEVTELTSVNGKIPDTLAACVSTALKGSRLAPGGRPPSEPLRVTGMRIAFRDSSSSVRATAAPSGQPLLVGPRTDRCLGLYGYAPPRPLGELHREFEEARANATSAAKEDPDAEARALQRAYDVALELRRRIELDGWQPDVPPETRRRLAEQLATVERLAVEMGARIGCVPNAE